MIIAFVGGLITSSFLSSDLDGVARHAKWLVTRTDSSCGLRG
jgi:hypothetical protein